MVESKQLRASLERGELAPADAIVPLDELAHGGTTRDARDGARAVLGDLAGRAYDADWDTAERAAFALLELARLADGARDRRAVITAMGRGFRNAWLLPYIHRRLFDDDAGVVGAAIAAAGGLGFPALEGSVAGFVDDDRPPRLRLAAIAALGRMGAMTAVDQLAVLVTGEPGEAAAALTALTEIRSPAGVAAATRVLDHDLEPEVQVAAVRYLAELGATDVLPTLRRLARHHDADIRVAASLASRALAAERDRDAAERFLVALSEPDRAVRAVLARRLRTLATADVLAQADVLLGDDPAGVVQVLGELRDAEVTRYLLAVAARGDLPPMVRARAIGAIEANLPWERDALTTIATDDAADDAIRAAAIHGLGAFADAGDLMKRVGDLRGGPTPVRAALLWAVQLAVRPTPEAGSPSTSGHAWHAGVPSAVCKLVGDLLDDDDPAVRRRAGYVAGNLELHDLAGGLVALTAKHHAAPLRLAGHVALGELADSTVAVGLVDAALAEDDPRVLTAASRALAAITLPAAQAGRLADKARSLFGHQDARAREAGARLAGLGPGVAVGDVAALLADDAPSVRAAAATALGRIAGGDRALLGVLDDADDALAERAALGLIACGSVAAAPRLAAFASGDGDPDVRAAVASAIVVPAGAPGPTRDALAAAIARLDADDPAFEPLLRKKLELDAGSTPVAGPDVDGAIGQLFPSFGHMISLRGFETLVRSLRTAESLYQTTVRQSDADQSPAIVLWMKVLENYVHAWLASRLAALQRDPAALFDYVDRVASGAWPTYQRWLESRWRDPVDIGSARVEIPLRAIVNSIRELQEHRRKRLDSPLSITDWSRLMVLFAVDHPAGIRNLFKLKAASSDDTIKLAHRLHSLAAVRNVVTHRAAAGADTAQAFRHGFYAAFETLVHLA